MLLKLSIHHVEKKFQENENSFPPSNENISLLFSQCFLLENIAVHGHDTSLPS